MPRTRFVLIVVLALLLSACGGGQEQEYVDAIAASVRQGNSTFQVSQEQAQCIGNAFVDTLGVSAFQEVGLTPEEIRSGADPLQDANQLAIDRATAGQLYDALNECVDLSKLVLQGIQQANLPPEARKCIANNLSEDLIRQVFAVRLSGGTVRGNPQLTRKLTTAFAECADELRGG